MTNLVLAQPSPSVRAARVAWPNAASIGWAMGLVGVVGAVGFMATLHLIAGARIEPMTSTMSMAAFAPHVGWMFPAGVLSMALVSLGALVSLRSGPLRAGWFASFAVSVAALGIVLVALFPTDIVGAGSLSAQIHRYAAAVVMFAVPVAALVVAAALRGRPELTAWRRVLLAGAAATIGVVIVTGVAIFLPSFFEPARGLIQRSLLLCELVLLALLVYLPRRAAVVASR
jgi:Protein of unknown function (DUF998)